MRRDAKTGCKYGPISLQEQQGENEHVFGVVAPHCTEIPVSFFLYL
jgi:hypothetical protein